MSQYSSLKEIFTALNNKATYNDWTKTRVIKITLGNSVIRVFEKETKKDLIKCLADIFVDEVVSLSDQASYDQWHQKQITKVYNTLKKRPVNIERLTEDGLKWGHSTKVFNIFIGHLIFYSPYFNPADVKRVKHFLHVPLDKKVFDALRDCKVSHVPSSIKSITKSRYYELQSLIREAAGAGIPLHFDEYAWAFDKE
jgi:hypothetical protein